MYGGAAPGQGGSEAPSGEQRLADRPHPRTGRVRRPGQFALLQAEPSACFLARPLSMALEEEERVSFLVAPIGAGTRELSRLLAGTSCGCWVPSATASTSTPCWGPPPAGWCWWAGVWGWRPSASLAAGRAHEELARAAWSVIQEVLVLLGFRDAAQAEAAAPVLRRWRSWRDRRDVPLRHHDRGREPGDAGVGHGSACRRSSARAIGSPSVGRRPWPSGVAGMLGRGRGQELVQPGGGDGLRRRLVPRLRHPPGRRHAGPRCAEGPVFAGESVSGQRPRRIAGEGREAMTASDRRWLAARRGTRTSRSAWVPSSSPIRSSTPPGTMELFDLADVLGPSSLRHPPVAAYVPKTITLGPRAGNPPPRILETAGGMINAIGLEGEGLELSRANVCRVLRALPCPLILSVGGFSVRGIRAPGRGPRRALEAGDGAAAGLEGAIDEPRGGSVGWMRRVGLELNISCPNVHSGCIVHQGPTRRRPSRSWPPSRGVWPGLLVAKLTPNVTDIVPDRPGGRRGGRDALAAVNTFKGLVIDRRTPQALSGQRHRRAFGAGHQAPGPSLRLRALRGCRGAPHRHGWRRQCRGRPRLHRLRGAGGRGGLGALPGSLLPSRGWRPSFAPFCGARAVA